MAHRLLVLGWHNIDPTPGFPDPPGAGRVGFARQLAMLARFATVIPLRRALDLVEANEPLPPRAVALTFDDGYRDNLELGVGMLARHRLPATFFLVPGFLSGTVPAWWEDLAAGFDDTTVASWEWDGRRFDLSDPTARQAAHGAVRASLKRLDHARRVETVAAITDRLRTRPSTGPGLFMDWTGARALLAAGHEIGSHTASHAILARESVEAQTAEMADARRDLESGLGVPVDTLAYPNGTAGDYSEQTCAAAASLGYRAAITTRAGLASRADPPYEMRRVVVTPTTDLRSVAAKGWRKARTLLRRTVSS